MGRGIRVFNNFGSQDIYLSINPSLSHSTLQFIHQSIRPSVSPSTLHFIHPSLLRPSTHLSVFPSVRLSVHPSFLPSTFRPSFSTLQFIHSSLPSPSIHPSVCSSVRPSNTIYHFSLSAHEDLHSFHKTCLVS